jgi:hypothetical protein
MKDTPKAVYLLIPKNVDKLLPEKLLNVGLPKLFPDHEFSPQRPGGKTNDPAKVVEIHEQDELTNSEVLVGEQVTLS